MISSPSEIPLEASQIVFLERISMRRDQQKSAKIFVIELLRHQHHPTPLTVHLQLAY